jgi:citronellol/citronellal dehydrogenase
MLMFDKEYFKEKTVLVTGGGSGIGMAIAKAFLRHGGTVFIASRKVERLDQSLAELRKFGECHACPCDIRQPDQIERLREAIQTQSGRLDILINNAGGQFPSPAEDISLNGWNAVINTNLNGTWYMTQAMSKAFFFPQKSGTIVNIIADVVRGFPGMAHTGAARAGVENLTKSLAVEWAPRKIRINAIAPGIIKSTGLENYPPDLLKGISEKIPVGRLGEVEEVAWPVLFLASEYASYITGATLYVDGASSLWGDIWEK